MQTVFLSNMQSVGLKVNKLELMKRPSMKSKKHKELAKRPGHRDNNTNHNAL